MDINSIRKRLNQLQTTNNRTSNLWKPQPGKQVIRVLPYKHNKDNPFIELFFHFGLNNKTYLSPISFGRPDPIEEFAQKLKTSGNREEYQMARKLEAKMRTFAPVIVRGEEAQGVRGHGVVAVPRFVSGRWASCQTRARSRPLTGLRRRTR